MPLAPSCLHEQYNNIIDNIMIMMMTDATCTYDDGRPSSSIMCYPIVQDIDLKAKKVSPARRLLVLYVPPQHGHCPLMCIKQQQQPQADE